MRFGWHLKNLFNFAGRENRQSFWLWVLITYVIQMGVGIVLMVPVMMGYMQRLMEITRQNPDALRDNPQAAQQLVMQAMAPMMGGMMVMSAIIALLWAVMLGAATVRRLHDSDRSGWWASPYFAFHLIMPWIYATILPRAFEKMPVIPEGATPEQAQAAMLPFMQAMSGLTAIGGVGTLLMIMVIVFCCLGGTPGPNRYGEDPLVMPL